MIIVSDKGMSRQNSIINKESISFLPIPIPVDPAGDYCYQGSIKPCEPRISSDTWRTAQ